VTSICQLTQSRSGSKEIRFVVECNTHLGIRGLSRIKVRYTNVVPAGTGARVRHVLGFASMRNIGLGNHSLEMSSSRAVKKEPLYLIKVVGGVKHAFQVG
jgi:hypothetical protein